MGKGKGDFWVTYVSAVYSNPNRKRNKTHETLLARARRCTPPRARWTDCRYFADLFGGQMLGKPTRLALALPSDSARHYDFDFALEETNRRGMIEKLYASLNEAGDEMSEERKRAVVEETYAAFRANIGVYGEETLMKDSITGGLNVVRGFVSAGAAR